MRYDDEPLFWLKQAFGQLDQDWQYDYADPYEALEAWFSEGAPGPEILNAIVRDVDQLFADEPDTAARLAHFPHIGWRLETFDDFLRALGHRAETGLSGNPEPLRAPEA